MEKELRSYSILLLYKQNMGRFYGYNKKLKKY